MFGWGPEDSSNRTVCEFNLPALLWPDDSTKTEKWVTEWASAFDKERLTNDFFKAFDKSLQKIQSDLQQFQKFTSAEAYTQAQLLLERLIFLYFLQHRGWLNQESKYLLQEFEKHKAKPEAFSYYKDFLEKVFWTLSTAPGPKGGRLSGLPFLNGGLFDDDEFFQPSDLRKINPPLKVQNGTFVFVSQELLEAFNFTVTEDTPLINQPSNKVQQAAEQIRELFLFTMLTDAEIQDAISKRTGSSVQTKLRWTKFRTLVDPIIDGTIVEPRFFEFSFRKDLFDKSPTCPLCKNEIHSLDDSTVDHIVPYSKGGKTKTDNAQLAHRSCNARKNAEMPTNVPGNLA